MSSHGAKLTVLSLLTASSLGACTGSETPVQPGTGGSTAQTGGASDQGGTVSTGGTSTGGTATVGSGGTATGGKATGGAATGGTATGGNATGGAATGGTATGGKATGGAATGGTATGGKATGGATATGGTNSSSCSAGPPETKAVGYGQATTGGGSVSPTSVSTLAALQAAIDAYSGTGGLVLQYTGKFNFASIPDPCTQHTLPVQMLEIKRKSNITVTGADGSAANFGIHIASTASNIIIRNMTFGLLPGGGSADAISVEGMSDGAPNNIWIDHNELFSALVECAGAGDTSFDGLVDFKKGADNVTVSYNYLHDHQKVTLNGFTDDDSLVRHITYHHNVFENVGSRTPLQRNGYSHVLNNYFNQIMTSGINVRMGGYSLIESNYFENAKNPVTSRDSTAIGYWELRNNNVKSPADFATYNITWSASSSTPTKDATDWTTTASYPVALGYSYAVNPPACLKSTLKTVAGAGKGLATLKNN
jgi:pectate lyase